MYIQLLSFFPQEFVKSDETPSLMWDTFHAGCPSWHNPITLFFGAWAQPKKYTSLLSPEARFWSPPFTCKVNVLTTTQNTPHPR